MAGPQRAIPMLVLFIVLVPNAGAVPPQEVTFGVCDPPQTRCVTVSHNFHTTPECSRSDDTVTCFFVLNATIRVFNAYGLPGEGKARLASLFTVCPAQAPCQETSREDVLPHCAWEAQADGCRLHVVHGRSFTVPTPTKGACVVATLAFDAEGMAALGAYGLDPLPLQVAFPSLDNTTLCV